MNSHTDDTAAKGKPSPAWLHEQVSLLAHQIYVENGCQDGRDWENWFQAEQRVKELSARASQPPIEEGVRLQPATSLDMDESYAADPQHLTTSRDEVRRRGIPAVAHPFPRLPQRSAQAR